MGSMRRRNPTTTSPGGRARSTTWSALAKRLGRGRLSRDELDPRVVQDGDRGAVLRLTMRNGDEAEARFPHVLVAVDWVAAHWFNRVTLNGVALPLYPTEATHETFADILASIGGGRRVRGYAVSVVAYYLRRAWAEAFGAADRGERFETARAICDGAVRLLARAGGPTLQSASAGNAVDLVMDAANAALGGHGVEALTSERAWTGTFYQNTVALYVNRGDMYDPTLVYSTNRGRFRWESAGDFVERNRRAFP